MRPKKRPKQAAFIPLRQRNDAFMTIENLSSLLQRLLDPEFPTSGHEDVSLLLNAGRVPFTWEIYIIPFLNMTFFQSC